MLPQNCAFVVNAVIDFSFEVMIFLLANVVYIIFTPFVLYTLETDELRVMAKEMRSRISMLSTKLVKQLKRRDKHAYKLQRNFDVLTAILQAVSLKRREYTIILSLSKAILTLPLVTGFFLTFPRIAQYLTSSLKFLVILVS